MFIDPTPDAVDALMSREITGPVVMLNLLRFRQIADYSAAPGLAPDRPISGREAYDRYASHAGRFLASAGGTVQLLGEGGRFLIGPPAERWDLVMLVRYPDLEAFLTMVSDDAYRAGVGHRTAALEDSRLLPIEPSA